MPARLLPTNKSTLGDHGETSGQASRIENGGVDLGVLQPPGWLYTVIPTVIVRGTRTVI